MNIRGSGSKNELFKVDTRSKILEISDDFSFEIVGNGLYKRNEIANVILTYNQESFISQCIKSVLEQEIDLTNHTFVIDDKSTDMTRQQLITLQKENRDQLTLVLFNRNQYMRGFSPLFGILEAIDCDFLAFCDGDDYWTDRRKLRKQINEFLTNDELGLVHTNYSTLIVGRAEESINPRKSHETLNAKATKTIFDFVNGNNVKHSTAMLRTKKINFDFLHGAYRILANDWLLYLSLDSKCRVGYLDQSMAVHRITEQGTWNSIPREQKEIMKQEIRWYASSRVSDSLLRDRFRERVAKDLIMERIRKKKYLRPVLKFYKLLYLVLRQSKLL